VATENSSQPVDFSGLKEPESLAELERGFEPCGGFLRRKGCCREKPSIVLDARKVLELALKFEKASKQLDTSPQI